MTASAKATSPNSLGTSRRASTSVATKTRTLPPTRDAPAQSKPTNARCLRSRIAGCPVLGEEQRGGPGGETLVDRGVPIDGAGDLRGESLHRLGAHAEPWNAERILDLTHRARQRDRAQRVSGSPRGREGRVGHVP